MISRTSGRCSDMYRNVISLGTGAVAGHWITHGIPHSKLGAIVAMAVMAGACRVLWWMSDELR